MLGLKVLVTGSQGFVGRHLVEYLRQKDYDVIGADIAGDPDIHVNVTEFQDVMRVFENFSLDAVVHLAAVADVGESLKNPYRCFSVNCLGALNVLEVVKQKKVERVVILSSANYYGAPNRIPVKESDPPSPRTPYDFSKVALENIVWSYHRNHGVPVVVLRPWKAFGEYEPVVKMVPRFILACLENRPIPLYNGGADVTDPYYVENLCYVTELSLTNERAVGEAFNVGTGRAVSVKQLAEIIKKLTGSSSGLQNLPPRTPAESTPMVSVPSIEKIKNILGYTPKVGLEEGLKRVINFLLRTRETKTGR